MRATSRAGSAVVSGTRLGCVSGIMLAAAIAPGLSGIARPATCATARAGGTASGNLSTPSATETRCWRCKTDESNDGGKAEWSRRHEHHYGRNQGHCGAGEAAYGSVPCFVHGLDRKSVV